MAGQGKTPEGNVGVGSSLVALSYCIDHWADAETECHSLCDGAECRLCGSDRRFDIWITVGHPEVEYHVCPMESAPAAAGLDSPVHGIRWAVLTTRQETVRNGSPYCDVLRLEAAQATTQVACLARSTELELGCRACP